MKRKVDRLREVNLGKLAELLEMLVLALTAKPPRWEAAAKLAKCLVDDGYGTDRQLEHVRNTLIRALAPLLHSLPETGAEMLLAIKHPNSNRAQALAAARIIREYGLFANSAMISIHTDDTTALRVIAARRCLTLPLLMLERTSSRHPTMSFVNGCRHRAGTQQLCCIACRRASHQSARRNTF